MPIRELQYPTEPYSKANRLKERADYSLKTIHEIVNSCPMLHVSFQTPDSPFPAVLPMIGQMGSFERPSAGIGDVLDLYLHGYVSSRVVNLSRQSSSSSPDASPAGLPVTIAASHLDGLVLALTPHDHSYNYRSALLFGHAVPVTSAAEKLYALRLLTDGVVSGRWARTRVPPSAGEMQSTGVLRVRVAAGSAKVRTGGPHSERDRTDGGEGVWTGVVPVYTVMGEPVASGDDGVGEVPGYLEEWRREWNREAEVYAREAVGREMGKG